jgi:phenylacetate-coenzyme A ligase PaaK-like adenylate-forming protein
MTELGYGGGIECEEHQGYHIFESDFYAEIVNPETGVAVPEGTWGELLVTTLRRKGMPLIRYRTGDLTRLIPGSCRCGSALRRLDQIRARRGAEYLTKSGVPLRLSLVDEALFGMPGVVDFFVELIRHPNGEFLRIQVEVMGKDFDTIDCLDRVFDATTLQAEIGFTSLGKDYIPRYEKRKIVLSSRR